MSEMRAGRARDHTGRIGGSTTPSTNVDAAALQRHVRDLTALLALPTTWSGREPGFISKNLIDVLVTLLQLDCACVRLEAPAGGSMETWQSPTPDLLPGLDEALRIGKTGSDGSSAALVSMPGTSAPLHVAAIRFELSGEQGAIVAGSFRPDFPTELERYLLRVAADQAASAIHSARLLSAVEDALAREQMRTAQLRALTEAAVAVNSPLSLRETLQLITEQARTIVGSHMGLTRLMINGKWDQSITTASLSEKYAAWRSFAEPPDGSGIYTLVCQNNHPMRMTQAELEAHPAWRGFSRFATTHPPMRGWLAAPLIRRDGKNLGLVQLSDKYDDQEFTEEDESILIQLAQQASVAIETAQLIERAEQAVHARDELLATVSHDLKNPLAGIKARAQLLRRRIASPAIETDIKDAFESGLQDIDNASDRMTAIIGELLEASRLQADDHLVLDLRPLNLVACVRDEVAYAQKSTDSHKITMIAPPFPIDGFWDFTRLSRAIANLLSNAIKYSPKGGEIIVEVMTTVDGPARGNWATVAVSDQGVGIPRDDLPHIFERFHRATNTAGQFPGTGIGLAGARRAVEELGGRMTVESVVGRGSIFTIWLPTTVGNSASDAQGGA